MLSVVFVYFRLEVSILFTKFATESIKNFFYMSKQVIVCEAGNRVYETLQEASEFFGVSPSTLSKAISDFGQINGVRIRWAQRMYALKLRSGEWVFGVLSSTNKSYLLISGSQDRVTERGIVEKKDLTAAWYFSKEKW